jgi:hypothetical protein
MVESKAGLKKSPMTPASFCGREKAGGPSRTRLVALMQ